MATRTFCDHCGSTIRNPKVLSFGDFKSKVKQVVDEQHALRVAMAAMQSGKYAAAAGVAGAAPQVPNTAPPVAEIPITDVDLCQRCVPLWLERVHNLCRASDPEEKTSV